MYKLTDMQIKAIEKLTGYTFIESTVASYRFLGLNSREYLVINKRIFRFGTYRRNKPEPVSIRTSGLAGLAKILDMNITRRELRDKYIKYGIIIPLDRKDGIKNGMPLSGKYDCSSCKKHNCNIMMGGDEHFCYRCGSNAGSKLYIPGHADVDYKKLEEDLKESK